VILSIQSTTFSAYGGIPTYNRLVCRVLNQLNSSEAPQVLIATDKASDIQQHDHEFPHLRLRGFDHNRLALISAFIRLASKQECELLLLGHVNYAALGWLLKKLRPQMRYGVALYGIEAWRRLPWFKRRAVQNADFLIAISDYTRQRVAGANGVTVDSVHLLPNALESVPVSLMTASSVNCDVGNTLLSVCRLEASERYKGVDKVIEVLPVIALQVPGVQYVVVGGGSDLDRHKGLAQQMGVADRVHFTGFLNDEALTALYQECDVFVMPSAGEGFGFVFLEAMKHRKAIVAANSGGAPEVVEDEVTGRLVEYGDQDELAQALIELCLDPEKRGRLGAAGYQRLQERFTFAHFQQKLTDILNAELPSKLTSGAQIPVSQNNGQLP
jgi:glycosyltransferase involved in cell wall biosynthesis